MWLVSVWEIEKNCEDYICMLGEICDSDVMVLWCYGFVFFIDLLFYYGSFFLGCVGCFVIFFYSGYVYFYEFFEY